MAMIDSGVVEHDRIIDVQFADFMKDPFSTIRTIYTRLGRELTPIAEERMRAHLAENPGDGGGSRYRWADTGLMPPRCASGCARTRSATTCRPKRFVDTDSCTECESSATFGRKFRRGFTLAGSRRFLVD